MSHLFTERPIQHYETAITDKLLVSDDKATRLIQRNRQSYGSQKKIKITAGRLLNDKAEDMRNSSNLSQHICKPKGSRKVLYLSGIKKIDGIHSTQLFRNP